jgi:Tfp pilus assembly protein PilP
VDIAVSGVFRIYESVSSRPDPFTEFPPTRRDLRRSLEDLAIEELHLVGITIDPFGGNQAMVEDANGVPYILYENTILANNTYIAEITSNEVIVVQEVAVGIGEDGVEPTSIPTIYSMRLHEEGGL